MEVCDQLHAPAPFREAIASSKEKNYFILAGSRTSDRPSCSLLTVQARCFCHIIPLFICQIRRPQSSLLPCPIGTCEVTLCQSSRSVENLRCSKETVLMADFGMWGVPHLFLSLSLSHTHTIAVRVAKSERWFRSADSHR
jgi:hypothetical protein